VSLSKQITGWLQAVLEAVSAGAVAVWWADPSSLGALDPALLDEHEQTQLSRLRRDPDRVRYLAAHSLLRIGIGAVLSLPPAAIRFDRTCLTCQAHHGRPTVVGADLHVSLSHAGDRVVLACTSVAPIGVDVEPLGTGVPDIAFSERELTMLAGLGNPNRLRAELTHWVRKEAVLKASGHGLAIPPGTVSVSAWDEPPQVLDAPPVVLPSQLANLDLGAGYVGAVAIKAAKLPDVATTCVES
jgi:4'-phosphopantetheinyl transferase